VSNPNSALSAMGSGLFVLWGGKSEEALTVHPYNKR